MAVLLMGVVSCGFESVPISPPATSPNVTPTPIQRWSASGTLTKIDDNTLTLTTEQGLVTANMSPDITIQKTMLAYPWDLREGQFLFVIGSQDANSNITATSILIWSRGQNAPPTPPARATSSQGRTPRQRQGASGTLTKINGDNLTLTTTQGTVKVIVGSNTTVRRITPGTISDLSVGVPLSVIGNQDIDGNITATSIRIRPPSQDVLPTLPAGS